MAVKHILWEIASSRLKEVGYFVERESGRLAVRKRPHTFPDYCIIREGKCSERRIEHLIRKLAE